MKKNLYYRSVAQRHNIIKQFILTLFSAFSSYPRLLLEVFIRKNFGERYFNWGSAIIAVFIFSFVPYVFYTAMAFTHMRTPSFPGYMKEYALWFLYLAASLVMSFIRWREIKRMPGVFDFARYSLSRGRINDFFFDLPFLKKRPNVRTVETLVEPGLFFLIGIVVLMVGQAGPGQMFIICSLFYSLGYAADYKAGDDFIMNIIDERILNEDMEADFFENDLNPYERRGTEPRFRRSTNKAEWHSIIDAIIVDDEDDATIAS